MTNELCKIHQIMGGNCSGKCNLNECINNYFLNITRDEGRREGLNNCNKYTSEKEVL